MQKKTSKTISSEVKALMVIWSIFILLGSGLLFLFLTILKACAYALIPSGGK